MIFTSHIYIWKKKSYTTWVVHSPSLDPVPLLTLGSTNLKAPFLSSTSDFSLAAPPRAPTAARPHRSNPSPHPSAPTSDCHNNYWATYISHIDLHIHALNTTEDQSPWRATDGSEFVAMTGYAASRRSWTGSRCAIWRSDDDAPSWRASAVVRRQELVKFIAMIGYTA